MAVREHGLYRLLDTPAPDAALGGCYITHSTGPCVDTGVLVEFEGTLTLSIGVIKELAEVAGFSVNEEALKLELDNAHLQHRVTELEEEVARLNDIIIGVGRAVKAAE